MQQQKVDLAQPQSNQAVVNGAFKRARREMRRPNFRRHEQVGAVDAGGAQAVADVALVVVYFRGIDMAIAEPQRLFDHTRAGSPAQFPGAEPEQRNFGAVG